MEKPAEGTAVAVTGEAMGVMAISAHVPHRFTRADVRLRRRFSGGKSLDLGPVGRRASRYRPQPARRPVHAEVVRDLLLSGASETSGRTAQLNLTSAAIKGELDLRFARIDCPIRMENCEFDSPVILAEANLQSVSLTHCIGGRIDARHASVAGDLVLDGSTLEGPVLLTGAHLANDLHMTGVTVGARRQAAADNAGESVALDLGNIDIKGNIEAEGLTVHGTFSTKAANVAGFVEFTDQSAGLTPTFAAPGQAIAWDGNGMKVAGPLSASGLNATGAVSLIDAQVLLLVLRGAHINSPRSALLLDRLTCQGSVYLDEGSVFSGGVHAIGMRAGATVYLGCAIEASAAGNDEQAERSLILRRATIKDDLKFTPGFRAVGTCDLTGARVGGALTVSRAKFRPKERGEGRVAFVADRTQIDSDLRCEGRFTCEGVMSLRNAKVGGEWVIDQKRRRRRSRSRTRQNAFALSASGICVARNATLSMAGTVNLSGAEIIGDLTLSTGSLNNEDGRTAADLTALKAHVLTLRDKPENGFIDLTRTSVDLLRDDPVYLQDSWPDGSGIVIDGLTYTEITSLPLAQPAAAPPAEARSKPHRRWLRKSPYDQDPRLVWLAAGTTWTRSPDGKYSQARTVSRQPYQKLAACYQQAGKDEDARRVLHEMYRMHNRKLRLRDHPFLKLWNKLQNIFLGYGYAPGRAFAWIVIMVVIAAVWYGMQNGKPTLLGFLQSGIMTLGFVLPGAGYEKISKWTGGTIPSHLIATILIAVGLMLGATVIAAVARAFKR